MARDAPPTSTRELPTGTVTCPFTDIAGSTQALRSLGEAALEAALSDHRETIRRAIAAHAGVEVDTQGDAFFVAFPTAGGAVQAAAEIREELARGPLQVRIGLHTGSPRRSAEGYVGMDVHRAARIAAAGHAGQVLVSAATATLIAGGEHELTDLGEHRPRTWRGLSARHRSLGPRRDLRTAAFTAEHCPPVLRRSNCSRLL